MKGSELVDTINAFIESHGDIEVMFQDSDYGPQEIEDVRIVHVPPYDNAPKVILLSYR